MKIWAEFKQVSESFQRLIVSKNNYAANVFDGLGYEAITMGLSNIFKFSWFNPKSVPFSASFR
jgi:hypothetical protein